MYGIWDGCGTTLNQEHFEPPTNWTLARKSAAESHKSNFRVCVEPLDLLWRRKNVVKTGPGLTNSFKCCIIILINSPVAFFFSLSKHPVYLLCFNCFFSRSSSSNFALCYKCRSLTSVFDVCKIYPVWFSFIKSKEQQKNIQIYLSTILICKYHQFGQ